MVTQTLLVDWPKVTVVGPVAFDAPNGTPIGHAVLGGEAVELSINTKTPSLPLEEKDATPTGAYCVVITHGSVTAIEPPVQGVTWPPPGN